MSATESTETIDELEAENKLLKDALKTIWFLDDCPKHVEEMIEKLLPELRS